MTLAPSAASFSAIARPMPREAPVTSAVAPFNASLMEPDSFTISADLRQRGVDGCAILQGQALHFGPLVDAAIEAGEHLAGAALHQSGEACTGQRQYQ